MGKRRWKSQVEPELRPDGEAARITAAIEAARRKDARLARQHRTSESPQAER